MNLEQNYGHPTGSVETKFDSEFKYKRDVESKNWVLNPVTTGPRINRLLPPISENLPLRLYTTGTFTSGPHSYKSEGECKVTDSSVFLFGLYLHRPL